MRSLLFKKRTRHVSSSMLFLGVLVVLMLVLAACGNGNTAAPNPLGLINPGTLTVGSDTTYPPQEFVDTATGKATGFDVDLIKIGRAHV